MPAPRDIGVAERTVKKASLGLLTATFLLSSCGSSIQVQPSSAPTSQGVRATPKPYEATFGPDFPLAPPSGDLVEIHDAVISDDSLSLTIAFTGGSAYSPDDFCSTDFAPWVAPNGHALDVAVVVDQHPERGTAPPDLLCVGVGHGYTYHLLLARPFAGSTIHDLSGGTLWVREPPGLVMPGLLPNDWQLQRSEDAPTARPSLWTRVYAAGHIAAPNRGAGQLVLYQAFGAATNIGGGTERQALDVNGAPAVLLRDPSFGELLLQWTVGGDGVALVANEADLTIDQLLEIARAVEPGA